MYIDYFGVFGWLIKKNTKQKQQLTELPIRDFAQLQFVI